MASPKKQETIFYQKEKKHIFRTFCLWLLLIIFLVALLVFVTNYASNMQVSIQKESVTVWSLPKDLENFTILHVSDLHAARFRENQSAFKSAIEPLNYKAVVITGDMVGKSGNYQPFLELLQCFKPNIPIYFIAGDSDPSPILYEAHGSSDVLNDYILAAQALGAIYVDSPCSLTVGKSVIWFSPESQYNLDIPSQRRSYTTQIETYHSMRQANTPDGAANIRALEYRLSLLDKLSVARKQMQPTDVQVVLCHEPLTESYFNDIAVYESSETEMTLGNVSLAFAGHYNGGQWRYPWNNSAVYIPELGAMPQERLYMGISRIGGLTQYISPGLGVSSLYPYQPLRLYNPPTVTLITLSSKLN